MLSVRRARTFVPTLGHVDWVAGVEVKGNGDEERRTLWTSGPRGNLTVTEQELFLAYEPRVPGGKKVIHPSVRWA